MSRLASTFTLLLVLVPPAPAQNAEKPEKAQKAEPKWKIGEPWRVADSRQEKEAAERAERDRANTVLFAQVLSVAVGLLLVWVAAGVASNGFGVGPPPRWVNGRPAWAIAAVIAALGVAVAVLGVLRAPGLLGAT
jgi:hypothetical protein